MQSKNTNSFMLLTGIVAGASAVYFLNSKKGKKLVNLLVEKAEVVKDEVTHHTDTILEKGAEKLEEIIEAGGELAIKADKHLSDTKTTISQNIKETSSDFDEGIMTAVNKLKNA